MELTVIGGCCIVAGDVTGGRVGLAGRVDEGVGPSTVVGDEVGAAIGIDAATLVDVASSLGFSDDGEFFPDPDPDPELPEPREPDPELPWPEFPPSAKAPGAPANNTSAAIATTRTRHSFMPRPRCFARTNAPPVCGSVCRSPGRPR